LSRQKLAVKQSGLLPLEDAPRWAGLLAKHKCAWVTPHVARHTFASLLASAGVSIYKIAQWLGDDVRVVQQHYAKLLPKDADIEAAF